MNKQGEGREMTREQMLSALFANMIIQQTNMAFMFLGRVPHPETGEVMRDIESAQYFIDQLEMLEVKTKGNLSKEEEGMLKQSLTGLRLAFVEAMEGGQTPGAPSPSTSTGDRPTKAEEMPARPAEAVSPGKIVSPSDERPASADDENRKKFSKKY